MTKIFDQFVRNQPLHVTAIASYPIYPAKMGGQKGIALFYGAFSKLVPVTLVSTKTNTEPENLNAEFIKLLSGSKWRYVNPLLFFKVRKILKARKSTHLVLEHPYYGWLGILLKWFTRIQLVVHSHNIESRRFKTMGKWWWRIMYVYEKTIHRAADMSFFISDEDKNFAIDHFRLTAKKAVTITYGFDLAQPPSKAEKEACKNQICEQHGLNPNHSILLFNGTLDYQPNLDALMLILKKINPLLLKKEFPYTIIICGKNLPEYLNQLSAYQSQNIIYAGFVNDISLYFKAADVFINPVTDGGGIKTKLVEALGYNVSSVSTKSGAIGVPANITNGKLQIIEDEDISGFCDKIMESLQHPLEITGSFYEHFQWDNIAMRAKEAIMH